MNYLRLQAFSTWAVLGTLLFVFAGTFLTYRIIADSDPQRGFVSFTGKSELATVAVSATESQDQWGLSGGFICYDPLWPLPPDMVVPISDTRKDALCRGPRGASGRKYVPVGEEVSLSVARATIEVAISDPPYMVDDSLFPLGKAPSAMLIIKKVSALDAGEDLENNNGDAILTDAGGSQTILWDEAEIHIPIDEKTLMPFEGKISLGQEKSSNSSNQLRSGIVAVYREITNPTGFRWLGLGAEGPQLVRETNLFPGDTLKYADEKGRLVASAGFMRAGKDDQGGFIEIVSSMRSSDGSAVVKRATPGPVSGGSSDEIVIGLQFADAVFGHPYTVWLGALVTLFVLAKEISEFLRGSFRSGN